MDHAHTEHREPEVLLYRSAPVILSIDNEDMNHDFSVSCDMDVLAGAFSFISSTGFPSNLSLNHLKPSNNPSPVTTEVFTAY